MALDLRLLTLGDMQDLEAFLQPRLESSMFLLGNARAAGLVDKGQLLQGSYIAALEEGHIAAVVAHYWNGNLVLQAPEGAAGAGLAAVRASGRALKGVLGPDEQVEAFLKSLALPLDAFKIDDTEKLYSLRLAELVVPAASAQVRRAEPNDLEPLTRWRVAYARETLGETDTSDLWASCGAAVRRYVAERRMWLLQACGLPVSCSGFNTRTQEAVQVGGVYTPPEYRSRGYARAVVAASLQGARSEGATTAVLFTPRTNRTAQRAYEAIGFRPRGLYRVALLKQPITV